MDVVLGGGPASLAAYQAYRRRDPQHQLRIIYPEPFPYSRAVLPRILAGELPEGPLGEPLAADHFQGSVIALDPVAHLLRLNDGQPIPFDRALIATGSIASRPPIPGLNGSGIHTLRELADVQTLQALRPGRAVILGAGPVGLQAALALTARGFTVRVLELREQLLPEQLDPLAAGLYQRRLEARGLSFFFSRHLTEVNQAPGGLELMVDGEVWSTETLLVATGVRPRLDFLGSFAPVDGRGLPVNDRLETVWPGIYAAGDVALVPDLLTGSVAPSPIWPHATRSGKIAGANLAGDDQLYPGVFGHQHPFSLAGLAAISVGRLQPEAGDEVLWRHTAPEVYRRLVFREDRLVGALSVGDIQGVGTLAALILSGRPVRAAASRLLAGGSLAGTLAS